MTIVEKAKSKYESREKQNSEIIEAAIKVFTDMNYDVGTMAMIAKEVGISEAMLYKHFDSKKTLFITCFQEILSDLMHRYKECYKRNLDNPLGYLEDSAVEYLRYIKESTNGSKFMVHILSKIRDEDLKKPFISFFQDSIDTVKKALDLAKEKGDISKKANTELIAWEYVGHYYSIILAREMDSAPLLDENVLRSMVRGMFQRS